MLYMRALVISDIHANLTALEAVLADAPDHDATWCLGDLVGYGPDPDKCIERVRSLPGLLCLIGNHDLAALKAIPLSRFNSEARAAVTWSGEKLSKDSAAFLRSLPLKAAYDSFTLAHGSPSQPVWEYVLHEQIAERNFEAFETDYCLVGHSHLPLLFHRPSSHDLPTLIAPSWSESIPLKPRMILNPGSVGQPRDMDPRAAYALLDLEANTWEPRRAEYDIEEVQARMLEAGLPETQATRLSLGW
ncbi:MAG: metallophosphoesterase family protein [Anaerolineales bacterium]